MTVTDPGADSGADSWPWGASAPPPEPDSASAGTARAQLARACARVFRDADGALVLGHLRALTTHRVLGPESSEAALRTLEGQRALVAHLERLLTEGRLGSPPGT